MTVWAIVAANVVCYLIAARLVFRALTEAAASGTFGSDLANPRSDWDRVAVDLVIALLIAMVWPLVFAFMGLRVALGAKDAQTFARRLGGESSARKLKRREQEARERERHVAELERELELATKQRDSRLDA